MLRNSVTALLLLFLLASFSFAQGPDVQTVNGVTLVPVRAVAVWLGASLTVDPTRTTATMTLEKQSIRLTVGSTEAMLNDTPMTFEGAPIEQQGIIYIPIGALASFDISTQWNTSRNKIRLTCPTVQDPLTLSTFPFDGQESEALLKAAQGGDLETFKQLVEVSPKLLDYQPKKDKGDLLAVAVMGGNVEVAKYLMSLGMDLRQTVLLDGLQPPDPVTMVHLAVISRKKPMVDFVLEQGLAADSATESMKLTPLFFAMIGMGPESGPSLEIAECLLNHGANPNAAIVFPKELEEDETLKKIKDLPGFGTPMMFLLGSPNPEIEALLIKHGATPLPEESKQAFSAVIGGGGDQQARQTQCMNNLKQLSVGVQLWMKEHEGALPSQETVWEDILPQVDKKIFMCPADEAPNGYGYNAELAGKTIKDFEDPSKVILFADCSTDDHLIRSEADINQTRHRDGYCAVYLDGHVEFVPIKIGGVCLRNLKQLAVAVHMWAQDHDGTLPPAATVLEDLKIYADSRMFFCPLLTPETGIYGYNALLADKKLDVIPNPHEILLFADCLSEDHLIRSLQDIDLGRHKEGGYAVFLDGHAEMIPPGRSVKLE